MTVNTVHAFWEPWHQAGLEHVRICYTDEGVVVESTLVRVSDSSGFHASYRILTDRNWHFRRVDMTVGTDYDCQLTLLTDGDGNWQNGDGSTLPYLQGCYEIDISVTPFTNTLAIGRLALDVGHSAQILTAYIHCPELSVEAVPQRYTALSLGTQSHYRYEGLSTHFVTEFPLDCHSLVIDYPNLFRRIFSPP